ncbi:MAG: protoglobin domain-containing protein [Vicinamibacterales bacterium]
MATPFEADTSLMRQMGLAEADIERRLAYVGFTPDDAQRVRSVADVIDAQAEELTATFFDHLESLHEARGFMQNREALESARRMKLEHIRAMVTGDYGAAYVEARLRLGVLYAKVGLDPRLFLGAFHRLMSAIGTRIMDRRKGHEREAFEQFMSLKKVAFFDLSLIVDVIIFERERLIHQQQEAIRELSTPVLQVRDRLLILPVIGVIDTQRARQITESLLRAIRSHRAKVVVVDITGVPVVDSRVANHLMQTVMAARLMGTTAIVTGLSAEVAQALVTLGVSLGDVVTAGDLQGGLEEAERLLGYRVVQEVTSPTHARP